MHYLQLQIECLSNSIMYFKSQAYQIQTRGSSGKGVMRGARVWTVEAMNKSALLCLVYYCLTITWNNWS